MCFIISILTLWTIKWACYAFVCFIVTPQVRPTVWNAYVVGVSSPLVLWAFVLADTITGWSTSLSIVYTIGLRRASGCASNSQIISPSIKRTSLNTYPITKLVNRPIEPIPTHFTDNNTLLTDRISILIYRILTISLTSFS